MRFISEKIGEEYKSWRPGDSVFITSPTGTGKSTFIFKDLLKDYKDHGKRILYLVNRTILKEQLENELITKYTRYRDSIDIKLYQKIENEILSLTKRSSNKYPGPENVHEVNQYWAQGIAYNWLGDYDCVVCDEAHYFLTDSNYNTNTILSFKFINWHFQDRIRIFMSATINEIEKCIIESNDNSQYICTHWLEIPSGAINYRVPLQRKVWKYELTMRNDDIHVKIFRNRFELASLIGQSSAKWIVFVDSKEYGRSLKKEIELCFEENGIEGTVNFIFSNYESDAEAWGEVNNITKKNRQESKVLISTSVLDNGINLKDINLRNIAIFADNEVEFMQMLGRKRKDGIPVNLYIMLHSKVHFEKRLRICLKRLEKIDENCRIVKKEIRADFDKMKYMQSISVNDQHPPVYRELYDSFETDMLTQQSTFLLQQLLNNYNTLEAVKATYLFYGAVLMPNILSMRNLENLISYYADVISSFETDGEYAFIKRQLTWIGKLGEEAEEIVREELTDKEDKSRLVIVRGFDDLVSELKGECFTWKEIQERVTEIKDKLRQDFFNVLNTEDEKYNTYYDLVRKNKSPCSKNFISYLNKYCGIPFEVVKDDEKSGYFRFRRTVQSAEVKK